MPLVLFCRCSHIFCRATPLGVAVRPFGGELNFEIQKLKNEIADRMAKSAVTLDYGIRGPSRLFIFWKFCTLAFLLAPYRL